jgi:carboxyl-terminal processing protease
MPSRSRKFALAAVFGLPLLAGAFIVGSRSTRDSARLFDQVLQYVSVRYVDSLGTSELYEKAARGLVREIQDPYAALYSPKELSEFTASTGGRYGGLGMLVEDQEGVVVVSRVYPHTPAEAGGVHEGDRIIGVEDRTTRGLKLGQVTDLLKGTPGTVVNVTFGRPGVAQPIPMKFTRAVIRIPAVPYAILLDTKTGYIPLYQFNETAAQEVTEAVARLQKEGAKSLVIDLRGNGGGIVDEAIEISNLFLKPGVEIASVRGREGPPQLFTSRGQPLAPTIPLVIMIDGYTASASEIVAGALQDHDRALLVGTRSFGKGLVQSLYQLDGGWALKLTTAKWYTPSGRSIQKERKVVDGQLVEEPDSVEGDSAKPFRPVVFHSDGGRVVYGGGTIAPDVVVKPDTLSGVEQRFLKAVTPKSQEFYVVLYNYSMGLKDGVRPDFTVTPAWRNELFDRLTAASVKLNRALYDSAAPEVDRLLGDRVARFAFGDSTAKRRELADDSQLMAALALLRQVPTQHDLFLIAERQSGKQAARP